MPRYARILNEKQVYHIMLRGNNREKIFIDDEDKSRIVETLGEKKKNEAFFIYAYCIMDNHMHLLIKESKDPVARIVKRIGTSYAYYFNKKYKRIGHVFQDRYRSENVDEDQYLLSLIRYIHRNPIKPGIGTIEGYKWSSYKEYMNQDNSLVETEEILGIFSKNTQNALAQFAKFNHETMEEAFLDVKEEKEIHHKNINKFISDYLNTRKMQTFQLRDSKNKEVREELIMQLVTRSSLSLREIAIELGLNREMVRRSVVSKIE